jgi:hypothetical protein
MATCQCGAELTGRRRKCDDCKTRPGKTPAGGASLDEGLGVHPPAGLHERGRVLWDALGLDLKTASGQVALETCRIADRLDELDRIISGKGVLNLMRFRRVVDDDDVEIRVVFDSVLAEARMQASAFSTMLGVLDKNAVPLPAPRKASTPLDELANRRKAK